MLGRRRIKALIAGVSCLNCALPPPCETPGGTGSGHAVNACLPASACQRAKNWRCQRRRLLPATLPARISIRLMAGSERRSGGWRKAAACWPQASTSGAGPDRQPPMSQKQQTNRNTAVGACRLHRPGCDSIQKRSSNCSTAPKSLAEADLASVLTRNNPELLLATTRERALWRRLSADGHPACASRLSG